MCLNKPKMPQTPVQQIAAADNREAYMEADLEQRVRRRRAGAAADVLTGAGGIPATATMGGVAR